MYLAAYSYNVFTSFSQFSQIHQKINFISTMINIAKENQTTYGQAQNKTSSGETYLNYDRVLMEQILMSTI